MTTTTLKVTAHAFDESVLVRCDLSQASSPIEIDYMIGGGWESTQYQCADVRHYKGQLAELAAKMLAAACECSEEDLDGYDTCELTMSIQLIAVSSITEGVEILDSDQEARIVDPDGSELFSDGSGGLMYSDGANAAYYGPLSE